MILLQQWREKMQTVGKFLGLLPVLLLHCYKNNNHEMGLRIQICFINKLARTVGRAVWVGANARTNWMGFMYFR